MSANGKIVEQCRLFGCVRVRDDQTCLALTCPAEQWRSGECWAFTDDPKSREDLEISIADYSKKKRGL